MDLRLEVWDQLVKALFLEQLHVCLLLVHRTQIHHRPSVIAVVASSLVFQVISVMLKRFTSALAVSTLEIVVSLVSVNCQIIGKC